jgi:hypothetical protein
MKVYVCGRGQLGSGWLLLLSRFAWCRLGARPDFFLYALREEKGGKGIHLFKNEKSIFEVEIDPARQATREKYLLFSE